MAENNKDMDTGADKGNAKDSNRDIELRSEKVRNIVGKVPPLLLRLGIAVISIILIFLLIAAYFIPYREYRTVEVELFCRPGYRSINMPEDGNVFITASMQVEKGEEICYIQTGSDSVVRFHAPFSGTVLFDVACGDFLRKGKPIYTIIPDSIRSIYGITCISEKSIARIGIGQPVNFIPVSKMTATDGLREGYVSKIYPVPSMNKEGEALYKIEIEFPAYKPTTRDSSFPSFSPNTKGNGQILISDSPVLKRVLGLS
jgi:hypothetical protein